MYRYVFVFFFFLFYVIVETNCIDTKFQIKKNK